ncbi:MAG: hypothetical protein QOJ96_2222 [Alphaproteobacteria bacterium]|jgi:hypothetical protein|nr:hypothetical protein [Alphaproteobacteria bacterium]
MARLPLPILLAVVGVVAAAPAAAQFGSIFGNDPPRPPGNVPGRQAPPLEPQPPGSPSPPARPQIGVQSQPLPPPPGGASPPPAISLNPPAAGNANSPPLQGLPPGQRQPRGPAQPSTAALPPTEDVLPEFPTDKVPNPTGVFAGLDKITGRITSFDVAIGETVQFGALQVTPRACYTRKPTETPNTDAFIEVDEVTLQGEVRRIYTGWMFASSPGLHAVEHPIYDVWLTDCKGAAVAEASPPEPAPPRAPARTQPPPQQQQQRRAPPPPLPFPPGR